VYCRYPLFIPTQIITVSAHVYVLQTPPNPDSQQVSERNLCVRHASLLTNCLYSQSHHLIIHTCLCTHDAFLFKPTLQGVYVKETLPYSHPPHQVSMLCKHLLIHTYHTRCLCYRNTSLFTPTHQVSMYVIQAPA
jgi:hypothetical protein